MPLDATAESNIPSSVIASEPLNVNVLIKVVVSFVTVVVVWVAAAAPLAAPTVVLSEASAVLVAGVPWVPIPIAMLTNGL